LTSRSVEVATNDLRLAGAQQSADFVTRHTPLDQRGASQIDVV
jgi:hypothetical protein